MTLIYHNPRCSKSRQTLALLQQQGEQLEIIEYLKTPPTAQTLSTLLDQLGLTAWQILRKTEADYKALNLQDASYDEAALIQILVEHPKLIERPIVVKDGKARLGRPPETVLEIL